MYSSVRGRSIARKVPILINNDVRREPLQPEVYYAAMTCGARLYTHNDDDHSRRGWRRRQHGCLHHHNKTFSPAPAAQKV